MFPCKIPFGTKKRVTYVNQRKNFDFGFKKGFGGKLQTKFIALQVIGLLYFVLLVYIG